MNEGCTVDDLSRILVTGAAGHLGSHLVHALVGLEYQVTGVDRVAPPGPAWLPCPVHHVDLCDRGAVDGILDGVDVIVHCAAIHPWKEYTDAQYLDANIKATWQLYAAAADRGIGRIVLTSSIAAVGYSVPAELWPAPEEHQGVPEDLYSITKNAQETIARGFASQGKIQTLALRPPAFMPRDDLQTGFGLLGAFALVDDMVSAHVAAVDVLSGRRSAPEPLGMFEAFYCVLPLPYTAADVAASGGAVDLDLVRKYWPHAAQWLADQGFTGAWLPAVYDIAKARRLLGWEPQHDFDRWFAARKET